MYNDMGIPLDGSSAGALQQSILQFNETCDDPGKVSLN
jgi:hypothetical protein